MNDKTMLELVKCNRCKGSGRFRYYNDKNAMRDIGYSVCHECNGSGCTRATLGQTLPPKTGA